MTLRDAIRLAYTPASRGIPGRGRYFRGPRYDRSVVFWMLTFAVLNAVTAAGTL